MNDEVYWYYLDGRLKQHINPPQDPSSITFAIIRTTDIGYKQVRAEVILSIEGVYQKPKIFTSASYYTPKQFREIVENYVKQALTEQRGITNWTESKSRKRGNNKIKIKRYTNKKCKCK
jgi:hypothetical protein